MYIEYQCDKTLLKVLRLIDPLWTNHEFSNISIAIGSNIIGKIKIKIKININFNSNVSQIQI